MRSPLVAWRRLFAIGGAPAASHKVLSRAPSTDRLLDPLAGARVTNADRIEALARPLDIGGVLARVTVATAVARNGEVPDARVRDSRAELASDVARDVRTAREPLVAPAGVTSERRAADSTTDAETSPSRFNPRNAAQATRARPLVSATVSAVRSKPVARFAEIMAHGHAPRLFSTADIESFTTRSRSFTSPTSASGRNARVVVAGAGAEISRLLAATVPGVGAPPTRATTAGTLSAGARTVEAPTRDVSFLLADSVNRARAATTANTDMLADPSRAIAQHTDASTRSATHGVDHLPTTADAVGGFRALAQRTLVPSRLHRLPSPERIEPEKRLSSDLTLDALDSRVADSLARVLEREARRHGIDLAESRA